MTEPLLRVASLEEVIQGLIILLFFLGPILGRVFGRKEQEAQRPPARRPPAKPDGPPFGGGTVTWKDLLEGRGPAAEAPPPPPVPVPEPEPAPPAGPAPGAEIELERWGEDPHVFESEDLVPDRDLAPVPTEETLERTADLVGVTEIDDVLGDPEAEAQALAGPMGPLPGEIGGLLEGRRRFRASRAELRRAVILSEIFGKPMALRDDQSYAGPSASSP